MIKTLRIYLIAAAILTAGVLFYTKAVAPGEPRDSDVSISVPETPVEYTSSQEISGLTVSQSVYGSDAAETIDAANNLLYQYAAHWGDSLDSVPGQIAASAGLEPSVLAEEDYAIIRRAFDLAEETGGLFDPTIGALTSVWAEGEATADQVSWALTCTGWKLVSLSDEETMQIIRNRRGEALLCANKNKVCIEVKASPVMYELITTKRSYLEKRRKV